MPADWSILTSTNQLIPRFPKPNLLHHVAIQRRGFGIAVHRRRSHRRARGTSMGTACIGKDDYPWDGTWWHLYPNCTKQTRSWVNQMVFHLLISEQNLQHGRMVVFSRPQIMIDLWCPWGNYISSYKKLLYILPFVMHPNDVYPWNKESWSIIIWWWLIVLLVVNLGNNHIDFSFETNITCRGTATGQAAYTCTFFSPWIHCKHRQWFLARCYHLSHTLSPAVSTVSMLPPSTIDQMLSIDWSQVWWYVKIVFV